MVVGVLVLGWIFGVVTAIVGALALDLGLFAAFGLFVASGVGSILLTVLTAAMREGLLELAPAPATRRSAPSNGL